MSKRSFRPESGGSGGSPDYPTLPACNAERRAFLARLGTTVLGASGLAFGLARCNGQADAETWSGPDGIVLTDTDVGEPEPAEVEQWSGPDGLAPRPDEVTYPWDVPAEVEEWSGPEGIVLPDIAEPEPAEVEQWSSTDGLPSEIDSSSPR